MFNFDLIDQPVDLKNGEWVDGFIGHKGMKLKVRSANYEPWKREMGELVRSYGAAFADIANTAEFKAKQGELIAKHLLVGWENAGKANGEFVPYSKDAALKILTSADARKIGDTFRDMVAGAANEVAARHMGIIEDAAKN